MTYKPYVEPQTSAFGEILEQWASGGPGIVEQNVEPGFMFDELRRERPAVFHR